MPANRTVTSLSLHDVNKLVMVLVGLNPWNPVDAALGQELVDGLEQDGALFGVVLARDHVGDNSSGPLGNKTDSDLLLLYGILV